MKFVLAKEVGVEVNSAKKMSDVREKLDQMDMNLGLLGLMSNGKWNSHETQITEINALVRKVKAELDDIKYLLRES